MSSKNEGFIRDRHINLWTSNADWLVGWLDTDRKPAQVDLKSSACLKTKGGLGGSEEALTNPIRIANLDNISLSSSKTVKPPATNWCDLVSNGRSALLSPLCHLN